MQTRQAAAFISTRRARERRETWKAERGKEEEEEEEEVEGGAVAARSARRENALPRDKGLSPGRRTMAERQRCLQIMMKFN